MIEFVKDNWFALLCMLYALVNGLLAFKRTGSTGKLLKNIKEITALFKYKKDGDCVTPATPVSNLQKVYKYDPVNGVLIDTGEFIDISDKVQACVETALEKVLSKYLVPDAPTEDVVGLQEEFDDISDELSTMGEMLDDIETIRSQYGYDMSLSPVDVLKKYQQDVAAKLAKAKPQPQPNPIKGGEPDGVPPQKIE